MASCVIPNNSGFLQVVSGTDIYSCTDNDFIILQKHEYVALVESQTDWAYYLDFDRELFDTLIEYSLVAFIMGHALGRIVKSMGKV